MAQGRMQGPRPIIRPVTHPDRRRVLLAAGALVAGLAITVPVLAAASPSPGSSVAPSASATPSPSASIEPTAAPAATNAPTATAKPSKAPKAEKVKTPEIAATVTGTVKQETDAKGRPTFTVTAGGTTWSLEAGPSWYWGDRNPLKASVGKSVTIVGTHESGSTDLDVETVNGTAIRAAGKPPWAGGPWVVGPTHPGWKDWMAGGKPGKGQGRANAPGQHKDKTKTETDGD